MNHGCLYIHPSRPVRLSNSTGVCRLQSERVYRFCHVTSVRAFLLFSQPSERRQRLCTTVFSPVSLPGFIRYSGHERRNFSPFFFFFFNCLLTFHRLSPALASSGGHESSQVGPIIYYNLHFVTRFTNVENCEMNPESPTILRFVSCFFNGNKKGGK